jgi:tetratricopeptide (TPR) repeat protein
MQSASLELRRLVPQWWPISVAIATHELASAGLRTETGDAKIVKRFAPEFLARVEKFRTSPNLISAAELVESAIVHGQEGEALNAARVVLRDELRAVPLLRSQAARLLQRNRAVEDVPKELLVKSYFSAKSWRPYLSENPRDAVAWVELSRIQMCHGHMEHAKKSMQVALKIAPSNRYVLRAGARLYYQDRDYEQAHNLLRHNPATPYDPWLMAAEIALADYAQKSPFFRKAGLALIDAETRFPSEISELAGALGTVLLHEGGNRRGRNLIRTSLGAPTTNAIAQAEWISRRIGDPLLVKESQIRGLPRAWEARTLHDFARGAFEEAYRSAGKWIETEEYNSQAYAYAAAIANTLFRFEEAVNIINNAPWIGRRSAPILNAYAYAQASLGNLDVAERSLRPLSGIKDLQGSVALANFGMIAFRRQEKDLGKQKYREAIDLFRKAANRELEAAALLYFAYELDFAGESDELHRVFDEFESVRDKIKQSNAKLSNVEALEKLVTGKMRVRGSAAAMKPDAAT